MDGRIQFPLLQWITAQYGVKYVDMITEAGIDGLIANKGLSKSLKEKISISIELHGSKHIFISGHYDCGANHVDEKTHYHDIMESRKILEKAYPKLSISGLWIDNSWKVHRITKDI